MPFGFWKRKTIEMMLAELAAVEIALRSGVGPDRLLTQHSRAKIEKAGFEHLLAVMGDEQLDPGTFTDLDPLCDDVWHFDTEAIEDHGAYKRIVKNCLRLTGDELKAESLEDYVDVENEVAWVKISTNGQTQRVDLKVNNDWVDPEIFDRVQAWLSEAGSRRRFAAQVLGQDILLICKQPEQISAVNRATGLRFTDLNI